MIEFLKSKKLSNYDLSIPTFTIALNRSFNKPFGYQIKSTINSRFKNMFDKFYVRSHVSWKRRTKHFFFVRVWKPLPNRDVLKILRRNPKRKDQKEQYMLAVGKGKPSTQKRQYC